jgi:uncharacterized membrane protein
MYSIHNLFVLDVAASVMMLVLGSLSMRLGEALKIPRFYKLFYISVGCLLAASLFDAIYIDLAAPAHSHIHVILPSALRSAAGFIAVGICLRYWNWLFVEMFKR